MKLNLDLSKWTENKAWSLGPGQIMPVDWIPGLEIEGNDMQEIIMAIDTRKKEALQFIETSKQEREGLLQRLKEVDTAQESAEAEVLRLDRAKCVLTDDQSIIPNPIPFTPNLGGTLSRRI